MKVNNFFNIQPFIQCNWTGPKQSYSYRVQMVASVNIAFHRVRQILQIFIAAHQPVALKEVLHFLL
jgi:hypothetical protein